LTSELSGGIKVFENIDPSLRIFFPARIKYINREEIISRIEYMRDTLYAPEDEIMLTEMAVTGDNYAPAGRILSYTNQSDRISVEALVRKPSLIALSDIYYSGWRAASKQGRYTIYRGDEVFPSFVLPEGDYTGENRIFYYFFPGSFILGAVLSTVSVIGLFCLFIILFKRGEIDIHTSAGL